MHHAAAQRGFGIGSNVPVVNPEVCFSSQGSLTKSQCAKESAESRLACTIPPVDQVVPKEVRHIGRPGEVAEDTTIVQTCYAINGHRALSVLAVCVKERRAAANTSTGFSTHRIRFLVSVPGRVVGDGRRVGRPVYAAGLQHLATPVLAVRNPVWRGPIRIVRGSIMEPRRWVSTGSCGAGGDGWRGEGKRLG